MGELCPLTDKVVEMSNALVVLGAAREIADIMEQNAQAEEVEFDRLNSLGISIK